MEEKREITYVLCREGARAEDRESGTNLFRRVLSPGCSKKMYPELFMPGLSTGIRKQREKTEEGCKLKHKNTKEESNHKISGIHS